MAVLIALAAVLHYYLWTRLVRDTALPPGWARVGSYVLVILGVLLPLAMAAFRLLPRALAAPLAWVAYSWMGFAFYLLVLLAPADLLRAVDALARSLHGGAFDPARRQVLSRLVGGAASLGAFALGLIGAAGALGRVRVERVRAGVRGLSPELEGFTIVQLTDVHVGPTIGKDFIEEIVAMSNALEPDLVAITGDLVDGSVAELGPLLAPLSRLRARHGVFFVTGNHEYYSGADEWIAFLKTLGVRVLRNERVPIVGREGAAFDLAGIDDWSVRGVPGHGPDLERALQGRDPTRPVILLAHQPKAVEQAARLGVALQISGHTHGGQMFPFNYLVGLQQPYVAGLYNHRGTTIYVSRGTGYWGPPMRVGAPAELTCIELHPA